MGGIDILKGGILQGLSELIFVGYLSSKGLCFHISVITSFSVKKLL